MKPAHSCLIILVAALLGCCQEKQLSDATPDSQPEQPAHPDVRGRFAWLEGTWVRSTSRGDIYERWHSDDSGLTGVVFRIRDGDTVTTEQIRLVTAGPDVFYVAHPRENPEPVRFRMTAGDSLSTTFENLEHDFPTRITYLHRPPDSLVATIAGPRGDSTQSIDFAYARVK